MPEPTPARRTEHFLLMGTKLVLLGLVCILVLDGPYKPFAVAAGVLTEVWAVTCFVRALRGPQPPRPTEPVESYSELQAAMRKLRESEEAARGGRGR